MKPKKINTKLKSGCNPISLVVVDDVIKEFDSHQTKNRLGLTPEEHENIKNNVGNLCTAIRIMSYAIKQAEQWKEWHNFAYNIEPVLVNAKTIADHSQTLVKLLKFVAK